MTKKNVNVTEEQRKVLDMAIEFYIRLGLGQFSEIATRLDLIMGKRIDSEKMSKIRNLCEEMEELVHGDDPWNIQDEETSLYTLIAFLFEAQMNDRKKEVTWTENRIREIQEENKEKI